MNIGDIFKVKVEKLTNQGYGLVKINGFVVFIENVCPFDTVEIKINRVKKTYAYASILNIIEPSPYRIQPFCPMQKICGSCQIQFIDYKYQLEIKQKMVQETLSAIGGINIEIPPPVPSPNIQEYRCKIQYPVSQTKNSKRILAGYYKPQTHEIVNLKYCPIQPSICDEIIEYIRENASKYEIDGYNEKNGLGLLRHVVIRHSQYSKKNLVVLIINSNAKSKKIIEFAKEIYEHFDCISGISINYNSKNTNVIFGKNTECIVGDEYIEEKLTDKIFYIGAETFFQVNPSSAENIFRYVKEYISNNFNKPMVLDAYAGISAFGICVSDVANQVVTIEENQKSVELAHKSAKLNKVSNIEICGGDAEKFFAKEKRKFDIVILDPPRKGCTQKSLDDAYRLCTNTIIYVSCNPATLARDLKYLKEKGMVIKSIQPFDMFCHTYHIENVAIITCS